MIIDQTRRVIPNIDRRNISGIIEGYLRDRSISVFNILRVASRCEAGYGRGLGIVLGGKDILIAGLIIRGDNGAAVTAENVGADGGCKGIPNRIRRATRGDVDYTDRGGGFRYTIVGIKRRTVIPAVAPKTPPNQTLPNTGVEVAVGPGVGVLRGIGRLLLAQPKRWVPIKTMDNTTRNFKSFKENSSALDEFAIYSGPFVPDDLRCQYKRIK